MELRYTKTDSVAVHRVIRTKALWSLLLTVVVLVLVHGADGVARARAGQVPSSDALYSKNDPIQILTAETFYKNVMLSKTAWIVEFYSSWCGHCRNYAATWKKLADEVYGEIFLSESLGFLLLALHHRL